MHLVVYKGGDKVVIDSLTGTEVYVERKTISGIIGNSTTNNSGTLEIDAYGNALISNIDSGDTPLYRLSVYNGADSLMLYNPTTKHIQMAKQGDLLNIDIDFERGTKYYIGAKLLKSTGKTRNTFDIQLNGLNVLKVFLDGREIKTYTINLNTITVTGSDVALLDIFSELVVYAYSTTIINLFEYSVNKSEIESSTYLNFKNKMINMFEIEYYQYETIWEQSSFTDGTYYETMRGEEVVCFDSVSISQNITKTNYRGGFRYSTESRVNSIDNTADFDIFSTSNLIDMVQWAGNSEFRMLFVNPVFGRFVLLNNCKIDNGVSFVFDKAKNTKKFTLSCGNYIDIKVSNPSVYGKGKYGKGLYGSGTFVTNSHRRGD